MDFKDVQDAWNKETNEKIKLPTNLEKIQTANTPLDKIKKNLKNELIYQTLSVLFIGFVPFIHDFPSQTIVPFYLLFSIFLPVCAYYLIKLLRFYKRLSKITLKTKDSLYETYFDIRLNMELYKTFGFALTPFLTLYLIGMMYYQLSQKVNFQIATVSDSLLISLFAMIIISILAVGLLLEWWVHYFYGKYAKEIRKLLDELKEE
ncbi:hypothetical protein ACRASX_04520 [Flavobacterium sp. TMP13]|uniref:hypothetical protein n=1 Tax=Flavobacterium sp. TMP13 TaxID=3425950 RepID=UPI003D785B0F